MAISLNGLRNLIKTSIHGRRVGLDPNDYMVGPLDLRVQVENASSATTGTDLAPYGLTIFNVTTLSTPTFKLGAPVAGVEKKLAIGTSSTQAVIVQTTPNGANIITTLGTTSGTITFSGAGQTVTLMGITSTMWALLGSLSGNGTTATS